MRKLIILRGAMGCGKSTFINEHDLERFTLNPDRIRLMFNAPQMNINYSEEIPQFNNKKVWELLYFILEERMKKGEFTIIDAVNAYTDETLLKYKKLAEKTEICSLHPKRPTREIMWITLKKYFLKSLTTIKLLS